MPGDVAALIGWRTVIPFGTEDILVGSEEYKNVIPIGV